MQILKVISCLLDYPRDDVRQHQGDLALAISNASEISPDMRSQLLETLRGFGPAARQHFKKDQLFKFQLCISDNMRKQDQ